MTPTPDFPTLGKGVPVADYGLPGTKKPRQGVGRTLSSDVSAVIMAHHGALCFGKDNRRQ